MGEKEQRFRRTGAVIDKEKIDRAQIRFDDRGGDQVAQPIAALQATKKLLAAVRRLRRRSRPVEGEKEKPAGRVVAQRDAPGRGHLPGLPGAHDSGLMRPRQVIVTQKRFSAGHRLEIERRQVLGALPGAVSVRAEGVAGDRQTPFLDAKVRADSAPGERLHRSTVCMRNPRQPFQCLNPWVPFAEVRGHRAELRKVDVFRRRKNIAQRVERFLKTLQSHGEIPRVIPGLRLKILLHALVFPVPHQSESAEGKNDPESDRQDQGNRMPRFASRRLRGRICASLRVVPGVAHTHGPNVRPPCEQSQTQDTARVVRIPSQTAISWKIMWRKMKSLFPLLGLLQLATMTALALPPEALQKLPPAANRPVDFVKEIKPLFEAACIKCHAKGKDKGGFSLETRETFSQRRRYRTPARSSARAPRARSSKLVAGLDPKRHAEERARAGRRSRSGLLRAWIDQGAAWPTGITFAKPPPRKSAAARRSTLADARACIRSTICSSAYFAAKASLSRAGGRPHLRPPRLSRSRRPAAHAGAARRVPRTTPRRTNARSSSASSSPTSATTPSTGSLSGTISSATITRAPASSTAGASKSAAGFTRR